MSTTHFMLHYTSGTNPKNKLQEEVRKAIKSMDRSLVKAEFETQLKESVLDTIDRLNKAYPRCAPIKAHWWRVDRSESFPSYNLSLNGQTFMNVYILGLQEVGV